MTVTEADVRRLRLRKTGQYAQNEYVRGHSSTVPVYEVYAKLHCCPRYTRFTVTPDRLRLVGRDALHAWRTKLVL
jgi:hypothetical protein